MSNRRPSLLRTVRCLLRDLVDLVRLGLTSRAQLAAENLFLRKQVALYQERRTKPRRPDPATRVTLVLLVTMAGLAFLAHRGATGYPHSMASTGLAAVLALEIPCRPAANSDRSAAADHRRWPVRTQPGAKNASPMNSC